MSTYENNIKAISSLYQQTLKDYISEHECFERMGKICTHHDEECKKSGNRNQWKTSKVRRALQVHERVLLVLQIDMDIEDDNFLKRYLYPQLMIYLLLTCFDQLGQPDNWMPFNNWLHSKKKKGERETIINKMNSKTELDFSEKLFEEYNKIYSVKNSFFNFLHNIIPLKQRDCLLNQIQIRVHNEKNRETPVYQANELEKEMHLYQMRNDYTHSTFSSGNIKSRNENYQTHNEGIKKWDFRETVYKGDESRWISTSNMFIVQLIETVKIGIVEFIRMNS